MKHNIWFRSLDLQDVLGLFRGKINSFVYGRLGLLALRSFETSAFRSMEVSVGGLSGNEGR